MMPNKSVVVIKIIYLLLTCLPKFHGNCNCKFRSKAIKAGSSCEHPAYGNDGIIVRNKAITSNSFKGLVNLRCIHLQENGISEIKPEMFQGLNSLKLLKIQNNKLNNIENGTFKYLTSLRELNLSYNCLEKVYSGSFLGLKSLKHLTLSHNRLYQLQPGSFQHLTSLHQLVLSENCIQKVHAQLFLGLKLLIILNLSKNKLKVLSVETFLGLKSLKSLHLSHNKLNHLKGETFKFLTSLVFVYLDNNQIEIIEGSYLTTASPRQVINEFQTSIESKLKIKLKIDMSKNNLTEIHFTFFSMMHSLTYIVLSFNLIHTCELATLKEIEQIYLDNNKLTCIHKIMFKGLISLERLNLENNHIQAIKSEAFKDLKNLKELHLDQNNLTLLPKELITDLIGLQILKLQNNPIKIVEEGAFHRTIPVKQLEIFMSIAEMSVVDLSWKIFSKFQFKQSNFISGKDNFIKTKLFLNGNNKCEKSLCWIKQLKSKNIFDNAYDEYYHFDHYYNNKNVLKDKCDSIFKLICPKMEKWCINDNSASCLSQCLSLGYPDASLMIDKYFCPFQYFCNCTCSNCAENCALEGKVHVHENVDIFGCAICNCQCREINCYKTCKGSNFQKVNDVFGCTECKCICPNTNCDAKCQGERNGIARYNIEGCIVCDGCRHEGVKENNKIIIILVTTLLLSILIICLFPIITFCFCTRDKKEKEDNIVEEEPISTGLDVFTQNLEPEIAQNVKESWHMPQTLSVNHRLGNGQFGVVWSAIFESSGRKFPVAVKVAKTEYTNVWTMYTKFTSKQKHEPLIEKRRAQIELNNQVIVALLMEALIMKKFSHTNVLNMIGISMFEDKPCIILPVMHNGDLKKYLCTNKSNLAIPALSAFALGVTKGMVYLAEQKCIHCDLAARNCMLDANLVVKISDFGLAREINRGYYKKENTDKVLPIRWMSIEAIQFAKFTLQSDMWSLGVVIWEIFSCGEFPYQVIENADILKYLMKGNRLQKPEKCPDNITGAFVRKK